MPKRDTPASEIDLNCLGAGDSYLVRDLLSPELEEGIFEKLREEVGWNVMMHRGGEVPRLVAVQGEVLEDGSIPIYRHPSDQSPPLFPFTPTVQKIHQSIEKVLKHPVNHVLIQLYRSGSDYISEHSDKTIDVVKGSYIVNVSLGAERVMVLKTKKDVLKAQSTENDAEPAVNPPPQRQVQRFPLPHNSMFVMGLETNRLFLHTIPHDNRPVTTKSPLELAYGGERISLTFRRIGTFLTSDQKKIWGQGATGKTREDAGDVIKSEQESAKLIMAFSKENHGSNFEWEKHYGEGSDVLHFT